MISMGPVLWENSASHSVEYFKVVGNNDDIVLEGTVNMLLDGLPARISYRVECDSDWKTRAVEICQERSDSIERLALTVSEEQVWRAGESTVPFATGLYDVDLEITPATNTLPIRRVGLKEGESRLVDAVWVRFPGLTLERLHQRYTKIGRQLYMYENPLTGFKAHLEVDKFGLVVDYDGLWRSIA